MTDDTHTFEKEWLALLEAWQVARAAEIAAFPNIGRAPTLEHVAALEAYLARKSETCDVMIRMLELMRQESISPKRRARS